VKTGTTLERFLKAADNGPIRALGGKGMAPGMVGSLGRCAASNRNEIVWVRGAAGSADEAWGCHKDAADAYAWTPVSAGDSLVQSATIASGAVTVDGPWVRALRVDTEGAAASDDLTTISGGTDGHVLTVQAANSARTVVVREAGGNLDLDTTGGDLSLDHRADTITLLYDATLTEWVEVTRSGNA
jgi:hypothetical protein